MTEMKRYRRLVSIGNDVDASNVLAKISYIAKGFEDADESWALDIELSMTSFQREPYAIPKDISEAIIKLFRTIANARKRLSPLRCDDGLKPENPQGSGPLANNGPVHKKVDRLFLEMYPTIRDDANFRGILEAATEALVVQDIKLNGYGNCYPSGTIGCSSSALCNSREVTSNVGKQNGGDQPWRHSLWEHVGSSDSLENLHVSFHGSDEGGESDANPFLSASANGLPPLWEAIQRNKSLSSLTAHLYCDDCEPTGSFSPEEKQRNHSEAISTMRSLSESLKYHPSLQKLELRYLRDAHPTSLLVPHITDILQTANLKELWLERFPLQLRRDWLAFPMTEFIEALSKRNTNQSTSEAVGTLAQSKGQLEVLRLRNVGLLASDANDLLQHLPDHIKILDLSNNHLVDFPEATRPRNSSELRELNLWKNPCLYNHDQETSLKNLLSLLRERPCLADFGPWDKWQCQTKLFQFTREETLQNLVNQLEAIADQNRCRSRLVSRNEVLFANPSLWPIVLSQTKDMMTQNGRKRRRRLLAESLKPTTQRQATVIYSLLRENFSAGIIPDSRCPRGDKNSKSFFGCF